jgi:hypothetical protein
VVGHLNSGGFPAGVLRLLAVLSRVDFIEPCSASFYLVGDQIEICLCYRREDGSTYGHTEYIDLGSSKPDQMQKR